MNISFWTANRENDIIHVTKIMLSSEQRIRHCTANQLLICTCMYWLSQTNEKSKIYIIVDNFCDTYNLLSYIFKHSLRIMKNFMEFTGILGNLKTLRESWNSEFRDSVIQPLDLGSNYSREYCTI